MEQLVSKSFTRSQPALNIQIEVKVLISIFPLFSALFAIKYVNL